MSHIHISDPGVETETPANQAAGMYPLPLSEIRLSITPKGATEKAYPRFTMPKGGRRSDYNHNDNQDQNGEVAQPYKNAGLPVTLYYTI